MFLLAACMAGGGALAQTQAERSAAAIRAGHCAACHGEMGDSSTASVPCLNGQDATYLFNRLHSLRYPVSESPRAIHSMGGIAPDLESDVIAALANYYAGQIPPQWSPVEGEGARLYRQGAKDVPACQSCHGARAEGKGNAPRLAGQHADYLELQLQSFAMAAWVADPMNRHVWLMTPDQMKALARYLGN